jgi:hypothetical protein
MERWLAFDPLKGGTLMTPDSHSVILNRGDKYRAQELGIREKRLTMQESTSILFP